MLSPEAYEKYSGMKYEALPTPEESLIRMLMFSKAEHSLQDWQDEFESMACQYDSHESLEYQIFKTMVDNNEVPIEYRLPILMDIYILRRVKKSFGQLLKKILREEPAETRLNRQKWLREELADVIDENDCVTIYRGEHLGMFGGHGGSSRPIHLAASYTIDYEVAKWFAKRFRPVEAYVYTLSIPIDKIAWYMDDREEAEIIVPPLGKGYTKYLVKLEKIDLSTEESG